MNDSKLHQKLCYEHEVLWAIYEIREHYLKNVVQEVYQGTGQILSLVRLQLSLLSIGNEVATGKIKEPGNLVGKAIHDLRDMCRYFSPETDLIENGNFAETIRHELERTGIPVTSKHLRVKGEGEALSPGVELIIFRMLQEILCLVKEQYQEGFCFTIKYAREAISFQIAYKGACIHLYQTGSQAGGLLRLTRLNLQERVNVINGRLQIFNKANKSVQIKLTVPVKIPHNE